LRISRTAKSRLRRSLRSFGGLGLSLRVVWANRESVSAFVMGGTALAVAGAIQVPKPALLLATTKQRLDKELMLLLPTRIADANDGSKTSPNAKSGTRQWRGTRHFRGLPVFMLAYRNPRQ
jgi:hypothetical protein